MSKPLSDAAVMEPVPLTRAARGFVVAVMLLQGLLLDGALRLHEAERWPLAEVGPTVLVFSLLLVLPPAMVLMVRRLDERRFWWQCAGLALGVALLAVWAGWSASGDQAIRKTSVLGPYGLSLAAGVFVALPYLQVALRHGRWNVAVYADVFALSWQNALTLALAGVFTGICWLLLLLWGQLFSLIGVEAFARLFATEGFVYPATGLMLGLGVLIGRTQQRAVQVLRRILFALFTGLLPLLAVIAVLFVLSLPFTGLAPLWRVASATGLLLSLVVAMVVFVNAVYQDGSEPLPYVRPLRWLVMAGVLTLPVFAGLALYALGLRIGQYGWTQQRLAGLALTVVFCGHALGYALLVLRQRGRGWAGMGRVNVAVSLLALGLVVAFNSPLLDPHRITVQSQLARLASGRVTQAAFDVEHLRFESGRQGWLAVQALQTRMQQEDAAFAQLLAERLERRTPALRRAQPSGDERVKDLAQFKAGIALAEGSAEPAAVWWQWMWARQQGAAGERWCVRLDSTCVLNVLDLDGDGGMEYLLCDLAGRRTAQVTSCQLYVRTPDAAKPWRVETDLHFWHHEDPAHQAEVHAALRRGEVKRLPPRWPVIEVAGQRVGIREEGRPHKRR